jgi:predicted metalloprotease
MKTRTTGSVVAAAVALAASIYVRPIGYFLPMILGGALVVWGLWTRQPERGRLITRVVGFVVLSMALTGAWQIRNVREAHYPGFSAISDVNLYFYLAASVEAVHNGIPYYEQQGRMGYHDENLYLELHPEQRGWTRGERFQWMGREGRRILLSDPLTYARIHLEGIIRTFFDPAATDYLKFFKFHPGIAGLLGQLVDRGLIRTVIDLYRTNPLVFWSNLYLMPMLGFYLLFTARALVSRRLLTDAGVLAMLGIAAYFLVIAGGPAAYSRFRHADMPIVCILAGCGLFMVRGRM